MWFVKLMAHLPGEIVVLLFEKNERPERNILGYEQILLT